MLRMTYFGNPFLGLFFRANDSVALVPVDALEQSVKELEQALGVKAIVDESVTIGITINEKPIDRGANIGKYCVDEFFIIGYLPIRVRRHEKKRCGVD